MQFDALILLSFDSLNYYSPQEFKLLGQRVTLELLDLWQAGLDRALMIQCYYKGALNLLLFSQSLDLGSLETQKRIGSDVNQLIPLSQVLKQRKLFFVLFSLILEFLQHGSSSCETGVHCMTMMKIINDCLLLIIGFILVKVYVFQCEEMDVVLQRSLKRTCHLTQVIHLLIASAFANFIFNLNLTAKQSEASAYYKSFSQLLPSLHLLTLHQSHFPPVKYRIYLSQILCPDIQVKGLAR